MPNMSQCRYPCRTIVRTVYRSKALCHLLSVTMCLCTFELRGVMAVDNAGEGSLFRLGENEELGTFLKKRGVFKVLLMGQ